MEDVGSMGLFLKWFSSENPTCRYRLRLGIPCERLAATRLADVSFLSLAKSLGVLFCCFVAPFPKGALLFSSLACPLGIDRKSCAQEVSGGASLSSPYKCRPSLPRASRLCLSAARGHTPRVFVHISSASINVHGWSGLVARAAARRRHGVRRSLFLPVRLFFSVAPLEKQFNSRQKFAIAQSCPRPEHHQRARSNHATGHTGEVLCGCIWRNRGHEITRTRAAHGCGLALCG